MRIRTVVLKAASMETASKFWGTLLKLKPTKEFDGWVEFTIDSTRLAIMQKGTAEIITGSGSLPVFEIPDTDIPDFVARAKDLGANVLNDGLSDPDVSSILMADVEGNEFEFVILGAFD